MIRSTCHPHTTNLFCFENIYIFHGWIEFTLWSLCIRCQRMYFSEKWTNTRWVSILTHNLLAYPTHICENNIINIPFDLLIVEISQICSNHWVFGFLVNFKLFVDSYNEFRISLLFLECLLDILREAHTDYTATIKNNHTKFHFNVIKCIKSQTKIYINNQKLFLASLFSQRNIPFFTRNSCSYRSNSKHLKRSFYLNEIEFQ